MIEETYDQSRLDIVPEPKFVGQEHALFERLIIEVAGKQEADRVVVSPTALTILLSSVDGGFTRTSCGKTVPTNSIHVGGIGELPVEIDADLPADSPASLYKEDVLVGKVNVVADTLRFI
jgi:hypothetical protein